MTFIWDILWRTLSKYLWVAYYIVDCEKRGDLQCDDFYIGVYENISIGVYNTDRRPLIATEFEAPKRLLAPLGASRSYACFGASCNLDPDTRCSLSFPEFVLRNLPPAFHPVTTFGFLVAVNSPARQR